MMHMMITHEDGTGTEYFIPTSDASKILRKIARVMDDAGIVGGTI